MAQARFPRDAAIRVLTRVLSDRETLDQAISSVRSTIPDSMHAWLLDVCAGTLRWKGRIDFILDQIALKKKPSGWIRKVLSLATYQILAQERTVPAKVVSETVEEVRGKEGDTPSRFANAVLRKVADHVESWQTMEFPVGQSIREQAGWASLPEWMVSRILKQRGRDWLVAFARACLERPRLWLRCVDSEWVAQHTHWLAPGPVPGAYLVKGDAPHLQPQGQVQSWPGLREGKWIVQDVSNQVLIEEISNRVLGESSLDGDRLTALDLCAAPGGKSVGMAWMRVQGRVFEVTATDRDANRIALLTEAVGRTGAKVKVIARDQVRVLPEQDFVWLDAPCTGSGIIRRHPEVRWLRTEKELGSLQKLQQELLAEAWSKVRPGGFLAYSVCSILKEEGQWQIERAGLQAEKIAEWDLSPQESPHGDGFWAILIRKSVSA